jgi:hypothetical protein
MSSCENEAMSYTIEVAKSISENQVVSGKDNPCQLAMICVSHEKEAIVSPIITVSQASRRKSEIVRSLLLAHEILSAS